MLDWKDYDHTDYFFGTVKASSQYVFGAPVKDGSIRPEFDLKTDTKSAEIKQFLTGEINEDWTKSAGFLVESKDDESGDKILGCWVHTFERNEKLEWTAEQVSSIRYDPSSNPEVLGALEGFKVDIAQN